MAPVRSLCRSWALFALFMAALLASTVAATYPNFDFCYQEKVLHLNRNDTSDPKQCWNRNSTTGLIQPSNRTYLSLQGCYDLCGHGFQFWLWTDTLKRFAFFILPLIVLSGKYAWVPLSLTNGFAVFVHLIGDPIDSFWSLLTRQEKARRFYHLAMEIAPQMPREVAEVWMAYDQWWQEPTKQFESFLDKRSKIKREASEGEELPLPARRTTTAVGDQSTRGDQASRGPRKDINVPDLLRRQEMYYIKKAASELAAERSSGQLLLSWLAIAVFLASLTGAYIRTATNSANNQTGHTLAVVMLFSFLLFAVYISGHVGTFKSPAKVIWILEKLHSNLPDLFPKPYSEIMVEDHQRTFTRQYIDSAPWAGINSSWRLAKSLRPVSHSDRSRWTLFSLSIFPILISWAAAFVISYYTPLQGFGCRSGTWTAITVAWILSCAFDGLLGACLHKRAWNAKRAKAFWYTVLTKDFIITLGSIVMVVVSQVGLMNTCWCRASLVFHIDKNTACIDLGPVTAQQKEDNWYLWLIPPAIGLLLMLGDIFMAGYQGENGRMLFNRTEPDRIAEDKALKNMKRLLEVQEPPLPGHTPRQPSPAGPLHNPYFDREESPGPQDEHETNHFRLRGRSSGTPQGLGLASPSAAETQYLLSPSAMSSRGTSRDPSASPSHTMRGANGV
ncbi:hypothetical protein NA57DRAFT_71162 [Rhizodiscina lignyota]|uniref:Uncharacterized protein n=1 Tax=Rhizodiscina lignyota TaxID=1504668 RepID=A0A9P4ITC0_9PEZI|nr:hypothetical protein NA57DRAFT_71162 [Rhizodiscina lignyota]